MQDFEKLGVFYLGREYDLEARRASDDLLLYDARDLTTHAVILGMTGSGKTGLGVALLEEAAIDAIPSIVVDPKGDLSNLMLTFPDLAPSDFLPYVESDEAGRRGVTVEELARLTATSWREGLAAWGQDGARIERLRAAADVAIYTPGSQAGLPLSLLRSFAPPPAAVMADGEALRERISGLASGLLSLVDAAADPLRSREHIFVANILDHAFRRGEELDLAGLIRRIQTPPFDRLGVLDIESLYPAADRFQLSLLFNNLLASPGFSAWTEGEPLDVARLLHTPQGRPRVSILSIAHLSDAQRMFFVATLLAEVQAWVRAQAGTSSLRAILYMDEIAGYLPPSANPPSKLPMLTLLKQARAFGLGVVLATQNPVDLDYKALSNAGTWFIGRLQTERDKLRLLDGLEGASAAAGRGFDRARMDTIISGLENRVFLLNDVHEDHPVVFQSRFALSYLRGPLTRPQIRALMDPRRTSTVLPRPAPVEAPVPLPDFGAARPVLPPEVQELFLGAEGNGAPSLRPAVFGSARLHFVHAGAGIDCWQARVLLLPLADGEDVDWSAATVLDEPPGLDKRAPEGARFAPLPAVATRKSSFDRWARALQAFLYRQGVVSVWRCAALKASSRLGESEADFRARLGLQCKELRDREVDRLRRKTAPKLATLEDRRRRARERIEREEQDYQRQKVDTALSFGSTILGALFGRKVASVGNLGRARSAARSASRSVKERSDIESARGELAAVEQKLRDLEADVAAETARLEGSIDPSTLDLARIDVKPRKADISIATVALVWTPA